MGAGYGEAHDHSLTGCRKWPICGHLRVGARRVRAAPRVLTFLSSLDSIAFFSIQPILRREVGDVKWLLQRRIGRKGSE